MDANHAWPVQHSLTHTHERCTTTMTNWSTKEQLIGNANQMLNKKSDVEGEGAAAAARAVPVGYKLTDHHHHFNCTSPSALLKNALTFTLCFESIIIKLMLCCCCLCNSSRRIWVTLKCLCVCCACVLVCQCVCLLINCTDVFDKVDGDSEEEEEAVLF